jgi:hypothetical protein
VSDFRLKMLFRRVDHNFLFAVVHAFAAVICFPKFCAFTTVVCLPMFRAFAVVSRLPWFCRDGAPELDVVHLVGRTCLFHLYAECKDTWGGPSNPTGGMCSGFRGSYPYNSWLNSLILK